MAALVATAEQVAEPIGPVPAALPAETDRVLRWLESPGTRLVRIGDDGAWALPVHGAGGLAHRLRGRPPTGATRAIA